MLLSIKLRVFDCVCVSFIHALILTVNFSPWGVVSECYTMSR